MPSPTGLVNTSPVSTTTATTTPWPLPAFSDVSRRRDRPDFSLGGPNGNQRRSTVNSGTCLKIMVSPVRVRVPPLLFSKDLQEKFLALFAAALYERGMRIGQPQKKWVRRPTNPQNSRENGVQRVATGCNRSSPCMRLSLAEQGCYGCVRRALVARTRVSGPTLLPLISESEPSRRFVSSDDRFTRYSSRVQAWAIPPNPVSIPRPSRWR